MAKFSSSKIKSDIIHGKSDAYDVEIIGDRVYRIHEFGVANCYLIVGSEKALLIDAGTGLGNLKKVVSDLIHQGGISDSEKFPLEVVATHAHPDHIGGMGHFPNIYIHKDDAGSAGFYSSVSSRKFYLDTVRGLVKYNIKKDDIKKLKYKTKVMPIEEGYTFNLGDKIIKVIYTPGHTKGSIVLIDETDKIIFTGDNVNPTLLHIVPGSTTIEDWLPGAKRILSLADEYRAYNGHDDGISTRAQIEKLVNLGEQLINEHPSKKSLRGVRYYPSKKTRPRIIYKPWRVTNKNAGESESD